MSLFDTIPEPDYLDDVFGPTGLLSRRFPGYEQRAGQVALARTIDRAMLTSRHMMGEGPTGTGKSVAYSVPAAHYARGKKRTVIVTANIALQEQLVKKDLPLLAELLPWPFTFALLKGRDNYYCHNAARDADDTGYFDDIRRGGFFGDDANEAHEQIERVLAWADKTKTGDKSELPFIPANAIWSRMSVGADECLKDDCRFFRNECFPETAKRIAHASDIIVTNYHVLFAHLQVRANTGRNIVLPVFDHLVLDEAHEASDIAREFLGFTVGEGSLKGIIGYGEKRPELKAAAGEVRKLGRAFFEEIARYGRSSSYKTRLRIAGFVERPAELLEHVARIGKFAGNVVEMGDDEVGKDDKGKARVAFRHAESFAERVTEAVELLDQNKVYFIDYTSGGKGRLAAKLIDVSQELRRNIFDVVRSVSLVSATLTTENNFDFFRKELGVPAEALEVIAETPFDFRKQAIIITPTDLPLPDAPGFVEAVATAVRQVVTSCEGRTLCLFTSNKNLNGVFDAIKGRVPYTVLKQGQMPRNELTRIFKEDVSSVLLGTNSFWTGIDVPGEALTGLVIDKLPFPNRSDPVVDAICERDRNSFQNYFTPRAVIMLRQGVGRLIRSQKDLGVVIILDKRIVEKGYGYAFFSSLPSMVRSQNLGSIDTFLKGGSPLSSSANSNSKSLFDF